MVAITDENDPNAVRIEVVFPADGYLVLAGMNDHGWEAFLDDRAEPGVKLAE